ncbi:MAG: hypothetical protein M1825_003216 [Sarcosagium campestre]|nr:MAG: hypothetical protein M1825_003216 [Sarcosagium campestre]
MAKEPPLLPSVAAQPAGAPSIDAAYERVRRSGDVSSPSTLSLLSDQSGGIQEGVRTNVGGFARRTLGLILLLVTVVLWTSSNFLASYMFADNTYSKPYFVTYLDTGCFALSLIPTCLKRAHDYGYRESWAMLSQAWGSWRSRPQDETSVQMTREEQRSFLKPDDDDDEAVDQGDRSPWTRSSLAPMNVEDQMGNSELSAALTSSDDDSKMSIKETARLSFEFCLVWFVANYLAIACLEYTTVASTTILTSTSSIWTLLFSTLARIERFTLAKVMGVMASLVGIILISTVDISGDNDESRGSFPHKTHFQLALGDSMAFLSAVMYGIYTVLMKKRIGDEGRVSMPIFFGLVGLFNVLFLWPGFIILHYTKVEPFELPPTRRIWTVILINSVTSLLSDVCWAYAMLLTSPLLVTVGLSLTIPLSLIGQMVLESQYSSAAYWVGAGIVVLSFVFVNRESRKEGESGPQGRGK